MKLISQLSRETGVPIHTIRYYETYGLFKGKKDPQVKSNNYSYYDEEVLQKLELIREAKEIGFTLDEIRELLHAWHSKRFSLEKKREILLAKSAQIDAKIKQLKQMKRLIAECLEDDDL